MLQLPLGVLVPFLSRKGFSMQTMAFVLIHVPLVAQDVASTLRESLPGAKVLVAASESELQAEVHALPDDVPIALAFLELEPERLASCPLGQELRRRAVQTVLLGSAAEDYANLPFPVLRRPFSSFDVLALIRQLVPCTVR
jgi:hypothetical protein